VAGAQQKQSWLSKFAFPPGAESVLETGVERQPSESSEQHTKSILVLKKSTRATHRTNWNQSGIDFQKRSSTTTGINCGGTTAVRFSKSDLGQNFRMVPGFVIEMTPQG
jgi:hypothetical protein